MIKHKPSPINRFRAAVQFYRNGWRKFNINPPQTKKVPFIWPSWFKGQPQWQLINYEAYANEGFNANAVVYSAIMYKVRSITNAPLRAYTGTMEEPELLPPDDPLQQLVMRPNKFQSWSEFQALATVYFNLSGNNYTVMERQGDQVVSMYHLRPDRVFVIPTANKKELIGFWYVPEGSAFTDGVPYLPQDVMHIKLPNPLDPLDGLGYGISPLSPAAQNADVDNDLTKFFKLFFKNGAMQQGFLSFKEAMLDEDLARAQARWMEIYGGVENWANKNIGTLDFGASFERTGFTFQEMDVSAIDARNESRIVAPFGVPLNLIESRPALVASTYNNKAEDRKMFWEDTMTPELKWFETDYQFFLQDGRGSFVQFDLSAIPALTMSKVERTTAISRGFELGAVLQNEYRATLGLDPIDDIIIPVAENPQSPIDPVPTTDDDMAGMPEATEEETVKANGNVKKKPISRVTFIRQSDKLAKSFEPDFSEAAINAFTEDQIHIEVTINDLNRFALEAGASLNWLTVIEELNVYFSNSGNWQHNWQRNLTLPIYSLMADRIRQLTKLLDKSLSVEVESKQQPAEILAGNWFTEYVNDVAQLVNDTTEKRIRDVVELGISEGWTVPRMQANIKQVFEQWMTGNLIKDDFAWLAGNMPLFRTEIITRTETIKAMNNISTRFYGIVGVAQHEWVTKQDNRVRGAHEQADGQVVNVGTPFKVMGESLMYPGDPAGSPENIIECRCANMPVV